MVIMLLLFSLWTQAEDLSSERYCFSSLQKSLEARQKFLAIQVPSDEVNSDSNCLIVKMRPHRRELIQRFFLSTFPGTEITFSSEDTRREPCLLKVEKVKMKNHNGLNVRVSQRPLLDQSSLQEQASETMQIQTLKEFELTVDQDQIKGQCRFIHTHRYEITIEVRKNPKPIIPGPLPHGATVIINTPPEEQNTMVLQTQLILNRGDKLELGGVIKDLKNKDQKIDVARPEVEVHSTSGNVAEKIYLSFQ